MVHCHVKKSSSAFTSSRFWIIVEGSKGQETVAMANSTETVVAIKVSVCSHHHQRAAWARFRSIPEV